MMKYPAKVLLSVALASLVCSTTVKPETFTLHTFQTKQLSDAFYCEGVELGDFNKDGQLDVVAGPYWYAGPDLTKSYAYRPVKAFDGLPTSKLIIP